MFKIFNSNSKIKISLAFLPVVISVLGLSIAGQSLLAAWVPPSGNPPTCAAGDPGCDAPLNSGPLLQEKGGGLWINTDGLSPYGLIIESGNVGIGTTGSNYKLSVQGGQINASGGLCINADCKTAWSQVGSSQWTTSGSNVYYNSGNVGIGTTNPTAKLSVAGKALVSTYMGVGAIVDNVKFNISGAVPSVGGGQELAVMISPTFTTSATDSIYGIRFGGAGSNGTYGTSYVNNISVADFIKGSGQTVATQYGLIINSLTAASDNYAIYTAGSTKSYFGGNVGIGTTNPLSKLSVGGAGGSNYGIYGYNANTGIRGEGGSYGVYGSGTSYGVYGLGTSYGVYGARSDNRSYGYIGYASTSWGNTTYSGVYGNGQNNGVYGYSASGTGIYGSGGANGVYGYNGSASGNAVYAYQGGTGYAIYAYGPKNYFSGNVGIGTASPSGKLHIYSVAGSEFFTKDNGDGLILTNNIISKSIGLSASQNGTYGGNGSVGIKLIEGGGSADAGVINFYDDGVAGMVYKGGYVGIGTTNPGQPLDVNGHIAANNSNALLYYQSGEGEVLRLTGNNGLQMHLENLNGTFRLVNHPWTAEIFNVDQSGNVGAAGKITAGTQLCIGADCRSSWPSGGTSQWTTSGSDIYYNSGNVGIGITNPQSTLSVGASGVAGTGIYGQGSSIGVVGTTGGTGTGIGVQGDSVNNIGVKGISVNNNGLYGISTSGEGIRGVSTTNTGVVGMSTSGYGVTGNSSYSRGIYGSGPWSGVHGYSPNNFGLEGYSPGSSGYGVYAAGGSVGVFGDGVNYGIAGYNSGGSGSGVYGYGSNIGVRGDGNSYDFYATGSGTDYGSASSIRWKKNIQPIDNALGKVMNLRGVYYDWDENHGGKKHDLGFIAEEVGREVPEIVAWDPDAPGYATGLDYGHLSPILVEAIKAQQKQIEELKREIELLKNSR